MSQRTWQGQSAAWQALYTLQIDKVSVEMTQATKNQTILLADDEADLRNLLAEMLEKLGYSTIEAAAVPKKCGDWSPISVSMCYSRVSRPGLQVLFIIGYAEECTA
jgi:hypothetical protein